ncbi:MAG TPA: hypothetical protein ENN66_08720 [Proteobacteria bacterium]|nr:hypothetical protein [Pseudomonadota bacterium]
MSYSNYQLDIKTTQRRRLGRYYTSRLAGTENVPAIKLLNLAGEIIQRFEETARSIVIARREILEKISLRLGFTILFYMVVLLATITWLTYDFCQGTVAVGVLVTFSLAAFSGL